MKEMATYLQDSMIHALKRLNLEPEAIIGIGIMLNTEEMADKMLDWLVENPKATQEEILLEAAEIAPDMD